MLPFIIILKMNPCISPHPLLCLQVELAFCKLNKQQSQEAN